jgi:hypothetical protein
MPLTIGDVTDTKIGNHGGAALAAQENIRGLEISLHGRRLVAVGCRKSIRDLREEFEYASGISRPALRVTS